METAAFATAILYVLNTKLCFVCKRFFSGISPQVIRSIELYKEL